MVRLILCTREVLSDKSTNPNIPNQPENHMATCSTNPNMPNQPETHGATCSAIDKTVMAKDHYPRYSTILNQSD